MDAELRDYFDELFDQVLAELPDQVHRLLDEVTMYVEDYPSAAIMKRAGVRHPQLLCGLYSGIPLNSRSVQHSGVLSEAVHIFREGIISLAVDSRGRLNERRLREQIRITVLHELGHHFGMSEDELRELGYG